MIRFVSPPHLKTYLQKEKGEALFERASSAQAFPKTWLSWPLQAFGSIKRRVQRRVMRWSLKHAGVGACGNLAAKIACFQTTPYHGRSILAIMSSRGFIAPSASVTHPDVRCGFNVLVGDRVVISHCPKGDFIQLDDKVHLYGDSFLETGTNARIRIGANTHIQPGCHIHAHISNIEIGQSVEIAANCGFYSYDHGTVLGRLIMEQALTSKGDIRIGDGAWLGYGVTVLQGVTIGNGAIIGAGSVVTRDIPENAIAAGSPANVIRYRSPENV